MKKFLVITITIIMILGIVGTSLAQNDSTKSVELKTASPEELQSAVDELGKQLSEAANEAANAAIQAANDAVDAAQQAALDAATAAQQAALDAANAVEQAANNNSTIVEEADDTGKNSHTEKTSESDTEPEIQTEAPTETLTEPAPAETVTNDSISVSEIDLANLNLANMTLEELYALKNKINLEIFSRLGDDEPFSTGIYEVGKDIKPGAYTITNLNTEDTYSYQIANIAIINGKYDESNTDNVDVVISNRISAQGSFTFRLDEGQTLVVQLDKGAMSIRAEKAASWMP